MVKQVQIDKEVYQCEICGHNYERKGDAECCEKQSQTKAFPLYGDDWEIGDYMLLFASVNGKEVLELNKIDTAWQVGHKWYPYPPTVRELPMFQFLAVMKERDFT